MLRYAKIQSMRTKIAIKHSSLPQGQGICRPTLIDTNLDWTIVCPGGLRDEEGMV